MAPDSTGRWGWEGHACLVTSGKQVLPGNSNEVTTSRNPADDTRPPARCGERRAKPSFRLRRSRARLCRAGTRTGHDGGGGRQRGAALRPARAPGAHSVPAAGAAAGPAGVSHHVCETSRGRMSEDQAETRRSRPPPGAEARAGPQQSGLLPKPKGTSNRRPSQTRHKWHRGTSGHNVTNVRATKDTPIPRPLESEPRHLALHTEDARPETEQQEAPDATPGVSLPCTWAAPHPVTHQAATGRFWEAGAEAGTTALAKRKAAEPSNAGLETETRWEANARTPVTTRWHAARGRGRYPRGRLGAGSRAPAAASRVHPGRTASLAPTNTRVRSAVSADASLCSPESPTPRRGTDVTALAHGGREAARGVHVAPRQR